MCKAVEEYARDYGRIQRNEGRLEGKIKGKIETIKSLIDDGISLDKALRYAKLDKQTYEKYCGQMQ